jgi:hypothetical protein
MRLLLFLSLLLTTVFSHAQHHPKMRTLLGQYRDTVQLSKEALSEVIDKPLRIVDKDKVVYSIASYQIAYRRKAVYEDEKTGKILPTTTLASQRFTDTPLPKVWVDVIREEAQSGEEILFFDIIVKDPKGKVMFAPNLLIKVL